MSLTGCSKSAPPSSGGGGSGSGASDAGAPCDAGVAACCAHVSVAINPSCRIVGLGKNRKFKAVGTPAGGSFRWAVVGKPTIAGSSAGDEVELSGSAISAAVDDGDLSVEYTQGGCKVTASIKVTVAEVDKIAVKVKATPALTARPGAVAPADHDFDCTETADAFPVANSLVAIRGNMQDVELKATVRPAATPVWWDVRRAPDDAAGVGGAGALPSIAVDGGDNTICALKLDNKGSFFVRAFSDCGIHAFDAQSAFRLLPVVLIDVTLNTDNTVTSTAAFTATTSPGSVRINTGSFDIANVRAGVVQAAIYMNATVDVVSGGADGRRLLDCVFAGWINNLRSTIRSGNYAGGHVSQLVLATNRAAATGGSNTFKPGDPAPTPPGFPILDTGRTPHGTGGETATLTTSRALAADRVDQAIGQRWRVEAVDSPGGGQGMAHPNFPGALQRVHHEDNFTAFLAFWTNRAKVSGASADPCNRVYGASRTFQWQVIGEWTVGAAPGFALTVVTAPAVTPTGAASITPASDASRAGCEVIAPNIFDLLATDART